MGLGGFFGDLAQLVAGQLTQFSFAIWAAVTLLLLLVAPLLAVVARRVIDPVAVVVGLQPRRIGVWLPGTVIGGPLVIGLFAVSVVGVPIAVLLLFAAALVAGIGYLAVAIVLGDRVARMAGRPVEPWLAMVLGVLLLRALRLVPILGGPVHAIVLLIGLAAGTAVCADLAWSWHRRRLPDEVQFAGEDLIEWDAADPD